MSKPNRLSCTHQQLTSKENLILLPDTPSQTKFKTILVSGDSPLTGEDNHLWNANLVLAKIFENVFSNRRMFTVGKLSFILFVVPLTFPTQIGVTRTMFCWSWRSVTALYTVCIITLSFVNQTLHKCTNL